MESESRRKEWFEEWFDETYLALYSHRDFEEARRFVGWLAQKFPEETKGNILDLACGAGRHAWVMTQEFGWQVSGVDLSSALLSHARSGEAYRKSCHQETGESEANEKLQQSPVKDSFQSKPIFIRADIRFLPLKAETFSLTLNLFTSFGYFQNETDDLLVLREISRVLRPNGLFLLDLCNKATLLRSLEMEDQLTCCGMKVQQHRQFSSDRKRVEKEIIIHRKKSPPRRIVESVRIFSREEIAALLSHAGLTVQSWIGDYNGNRFDSETSPRMIVWAKKCQ